ncbi:protein mono-ADP-ribosyltransferase PARP11 isoform X3 [Equus caballus]
MFHKTEELLSGRTDSEMDEMDTSDTQWGWFYLAECGKWHMFQPDTNIQCSVSSEDIEKSFKTNPCGSISFTTSKFSYKIDFAEMKQMNLTTGKQRLIKRAPFSISAFSYICENEAIPMPPHWENVNTEVPYQLIPLHNQTHEYNEVASLFGKTMDRNRIKRIQRIQNLDLWEFFCRKKAQLKKKRGVPQINEEMLFHGTSSEFVEAICIHNFDWRINGIHGALFGKGCERPSSPIYAHFSSKLRREMRGKGKGWTSIFLVLTLYLTFTKRTDYQLGSGCASFLKSKLLFKITTEKGIPLL